MNLVYILHFETKLHHAQHYAGSCLRERLELRMREHAAGRGARLTQVIGDLDINWRIAAVIETTGSCRQAEQLLKSMKHTRRYCPICSRHVSRLQGSRTIDLSLIRFPHTSTELRSKTR